MTYGGVAVYTSSASVRLEFVLFLAHGETAPFHRTVRCFVRPRLFGPAIWFFFLAASSAP